MATLHLSDGEAAYLKRLLERTLGDVRVEVRRTDAPEFRAGVEREKATIEALLTKLGAGPMTTAGSFEPAPSPIF